MQMVITVAVMAHFCLLRGAGGSRRPSETLPHTFFLMTRNKHQLAYKEISFVIVWLAEGNETLMADSECYFFFGLVYVIGSWFSGCGEMFVALHLIRSANVKSPKRDDGRED